VGAVALTGGTSAAVLTMVKEGGSWALQRAKPEAGSTSQATAPAAPSPSPHGGPTPGGGAAGGVGDADDAPSGPIRTRNGALKPAPAQDGARPQGETPRRYAAFGRKIVVGPDGKSTIAPAADADAAVKRYPRKAKPTPKPARLNAPVTAVTDPRALEARAHRYEAELARIRQGKAPRDWPGWENLSDQERDVHTRMFENAAAHAQQELRDAQRRQPTPQKPHNVPQTPPSRPNRPAPEHIPAREPRSPKAEHDAPTVTKKPREQRPAPREASAPSRARAQRYESPKRSTAAPAASPVGGESETTVPMSPLRARLAEAAQRARTSGR